MRPPQARPISGHVFKRKGKRGSVWYAKYRLPRRTRRAASMPWRFAAWLGLSRSAGYHSMTFFGPPSGSEIPVRGTMGKLAS
jgi:hypothetical protein